MEVEPAVAAPSSAAASIPAGDVAGPRAQDSGRADVTADADGPPTDADGAAMVLNEYRPGAHNGHGYTKGWYCDGG